MSFTCKFNWSGFDQMSKNKNKCKVCFFQKHVKSEKENYKFVYFNGINPKKNKG